MFTTPCFIRKNTKELREYLRSIGYRSLNNETIDNNCDCLMVSEGDSKNVESFAFYASYNRDFMDKYFSNRKDIIDCGDNEELFKAISALRNDSDYMQWFISEQVFYRGIELFGIGTWFQLREHKFDNSIKAHKATVEEIVEYFNN